MQTSENPNPPPITRTTNSRVLTLHLTPGELADRAARAELLAALAGPRPSRRWQEMAQRNVRPAGIGPELADDAALARIPERVAVRAFARAAIASVRAVFAARRQSHPHLVAPQPHPMRRRTDKRAA